MSEVEKAFIEFASKSGKQDSQEMLLYFRAGWIAAMDKALETISKEKTYEGNNH